MAKTYSAIQTIVCAGGETSITFNNIPQNYTDLKIVTSARSTSQNGTTTWADVQLRPTNSTTGLSSKSVYGQGSGAYSNVDTNPTGGFAAGSTATTNTFSNVEIYIPNYTSSNNKSWSVDAVTENNGSVAIAWLGANLWANTSAITSLVIAPIQGSFVQYSTFTLYGIGSGAKATGGTVVGAGNYIYHTFTSTGTFQPTEQIKNAEILLVAGGGSGSGGYGAGGGAGGLRYLSSLNYTAGTNYAVVVGAGGATQGNIAQGNPGTNSSVNGISATGGGGAGSYATNNAMSGGSGGGAGSGEPGGSGNAGGYSPVEGYAGGAGASGVTASGGGGGAGGIGQAAPGNYQSGNGGPGSSTYTAWHYATQTGVNSGGIYYIASGGGGGGDSQLSVTAGTASVGGGSSGSTGGNASAATANTGGGGGGGGRTSGTTYAGGAGGSGLVIIRYPVN